MLWCTRLSIMSTWTGVKYQAGRSLHCRQTPTECHCPECHPASKVPLLWCLLDPSRYRRPKRPSLCPPHLERLLTEVLTHLHPQDLSSAGLRSYAFEALHNILAAQRRPKTLWARIWRPTHWVEGRHIYIYIYIIYICMQGCWQHRCAQKGLGKYVVTFRAKDRDSVFPLGGLNPTGLIQ